MTENLIHHYFVALIFLNEKGQIGHFSMDISLDTNKITLKKQKEIKEACEQNFKAKNGGVFYENLQMTSISYLGEMTLEEYKA